MTDLEGWLSLVHPEILVEFDKAKREDEYLENQDEELHNMAETDTAVVHDRDARCLTGFLEDTPEGIRKKEYSYNKMLEDIASTIGTQISLDTPVQYIGGILSGWEDRGFVVSMTIDTGSAKISCLFHNASNIRVFKYDGEDTHGGIQILADTSLGDKEAFFKAWDVVYGNSEPADVFGKKIVSVKPHANL